MRIEDGLVAASRHGAKLVAIVAGSLLLAAPASAHHAIGGATPSNAWEGFLSGLAHPLLGLDHLAFVVAAGLLAALYRRGALIPFAFVAASLAGTTIQALGMLLPAPEPMITVSVFLFGALLVARPRRLSIVVALAFAAGIFHGYAYGQSIVGAEMTPLAAYLLGLGFVQTALALSARGVAKHMLRPAARLGGSAESVS
jgi:urease accessory protein